MKKIFGLLFIGLFVFTACEDDPEPVVSPVYDAPTLTAPSSVSSAQTGTAVDVTFNVSAPGGYASSAVVASGEPVTIRVDTGQLNYETDQAHTFTLTVSDGTHHSSQVITLNVADVNPMPQPDQADGFIAFSVAFN